MAPAAMPSRRPTAAALSPGVMPSHPLNNMTAETETAEICRTLGFIGNHANTAPRADKKETA